jgi:hypothetical protein
MQWGEIRLNRFSIFFIDYGRKLSNEFQDFDGALAVGGDHDRRVLPPTDCRNEFVSVVFAALAF